MLKVIYTRHPRTCPVQRLSSDDSVVYLIALGYHHQRRVRVCIAGLISVDPNPPLDRLVHPNDEAKKLLSFPSE